MSEEETSDVKMRLRCQMSEGRPNSTAKDVKTDVAVHAVIDGDDGKPGITHAQKTSPSLMTSLRCTVLFLATCFRACASETLSILR